MRAESGHTALSSPRFRVPSIDENEPGGTALSYTACTGPDESGKIAIIVDLTVAYRVRLRILHRSVQEHCVWSCNLSHYRHKFIC